MRTLADGERELFARLPFDEKAWLAGPAAVAGRCGEAGFSTLERIWARPTAEVNGMWGGHTGPGQRRSSRRDAHAKVSFRLVADQDPADVAARAAGVRGGAVPPGVSRPRSPFGGRACGPASRRSTRRRLQAAARAMERAFGREVLFTREGGSGPEADLAEILEAPLVFVAVGLTTTGSTRRTRGSRSPCCSGRRGVGVPVGRARHPGFAQSAGLTARSETR